MADEQYELLGAAEKAIVAQIRNGVQSLREMLVELGEALAELDLDDLEEVMLDSDCKESLISCVEPLTMIGNGVGSSNLFVMGISMILTAHRTSKNEPTA